MSDLIRREDAIAATELECKPEGDDDIFAAGMLIRMAIRDIPSVLAVGLTDEVDQTSPVGWLVFDAMGNQFVFANEDEAYAKAHDALSMRSTRRTVGSKRGLRITRER